MAMKKIGNLGGWRGEAIQHRSKDKGPIFSQNMLIFYIFGHIPGFNQRILMHFFLF